MDEAEQVDAQTARLINELLTRAGMLMEDASNAALLSDSCGGNLAMRVSTIELEITRITSIVNAAKALLND